MKRLHVHLGVESIDTSVRFYSTLFAAAPVVLKSDYAKWMLEDPRVNFAISTRGSRIGPDHFGIQVEDGAELAEVYDRLKAADRPVLEEGNTVCCYAQSEKSWVSDPQEIAWEVFLTSGASTVYGGDADLGDIRMTAGATRSPLAEETACCSPKPTHVTAAKACCKPAAAAD